LTIIPLNQTMSEVLIRNTISNINFIIDYNLDINLPNEADDCEKFLNVLINKNIAKEDDSKIEDKQDNENLESTKQMSLDKEEGKN